MESRALDEMDTIYDQIKTKEHEIRELREEIRELREQIKRVREQIKRVEEDIRELREQIKRVEEEIAIASGTEVRMSLEAKLQFLRQETSSLYQQISSHDQQISSRDQQISSRDQQIIILRQEIISIRSVQKASASAGSEDGSTSKTVLTALEQIANKVNDISGFLQESASQTRAASSMKLDDIKTLRRCLGAFVIYEPLNFTLAAFGAELEGGEPFWDRERYEPQHRLEYKQKFEQMTPRRNGRNVAWVDAIGTVCRVKFGDVEFPVTAGNDLVLTFRRYECDPAVGALLGVELKKKLSWIGMHQAEADFYVWSYESQFPFVQLITDMERGGVAIYSKDGAEVRFQLLVGMEALWDFLARFVKGLPPDTDSDDARNLKNIEQLPEPSRKRFIPKNERMGFPGPQPDSSSVGRQAASMLAAFCNNRDDVANLRDLDCFDVVTV